MNSNYIGGRGALRSTACLLNLFFNGRALGEFLGECFFGDCSDFYNMGL